jgi:polysaccharide biosynthesis protein PslG
MKYTLAIVLMSLLIASCSAEPGPAPTPTLQPVLPPLQTATPLAAAPPLATATPIPLGQSTPLPGGTPLAVRTPLPGNAPGSSTAAACPTGNGATRLPGLRYGVNIASGDTAIGQPLDQAHALSAGWVRATLRWSELEPQPGTYRWEAFDTLAEAAQARGLRMLLAVTQSPAWATANGSGGLPDTPEAFGTFMGALVGRAAGRVAAYEIWPAANSAAANGGTIAKPEQYAMTLGAAYTAIKGADPCALVLLGALLPAPPNTPDATDDLAFYRGVLAYNGGEGRNYYDILAVQPNTSGLLGKGHWPRENQALSRQFFGHIYVIRDEMTAADEADKQVWIVRLGYSVAGQFAVAPEQQAEYLTKTIDDARKNTAWISAIFVRDLGATPTSGEDFSLLNPDGSPRPVYATLHDFFATHSQPEQAAIPGTDLVLLWRYKPNPYPKTPLALGPDGTIYTISGGYVRAIDPNGALRVVVKPGRKFAPGVAADTQGRIYATGDNGTLSAYSSGGNFAWTTETDGTAATPLLLSADGQALYTGTSKERLDAYAASDGHKLWGTPLGGIPGAPALGGDGTIYIGSSDGALHAIGPDGTPRWRYPSNGWARTMPVVSGATIYGGTDGGAVFALDAGGQQRWRVELGAETIGLAAGPDGALYASTADGSLHELAPDGVLRWSSPLGGGRPTAPAIGADGRIYVGAENGRLSVVAPGGQIAGDFNLQAPLNITPVIGRDGAVYVAVGDKKDSVVAFGTQALKARYNAP